MRTEKEEEKQRRTESGITPRKLLEPRNREQYILHTVHRKVLRRDPLELSPIALRPLSVRHELRVEVPGGCEAGVGEGFGEGGVGTGLTAVRSSREKREKR